MQFLFWIGWTISFVTLKVFFFHRAINARRLPHDRAAIIAGNHVSYLDPPIVGICFRKAVKFLARKTLFRTKFSNWLYPRLNAIPIDQEAPDLTGMKSVIRLLKNGNQVVLFPEGSRAPDGKIQPGAAGVGFIVSKARAPVVPVRIFGAHKALPRGSSFPRFFKRITVVVGEPIEFSDDELSAKGRDAYQHITDRIMEAIAAIELEK